MATPNDERIDPRNGVDPLSWTDHAARYTFAASVAHGRVWDAACGIGYGTDILAQNKNHQIVSIYACDRDADAITYAKEHYANVLTTFDVYDVTSLLTPPTVFDTIVAFEMIEHLEYPGMFLSNVKVNLHRKGLFLVSTPDRDFNPEGVERRTVHHRREYTAKEFSDLLSQHFRNVEVFTQDVFPMTRIKYMGPLLDPRNTPPGRTYVLSQTLPRQPWSVLIAVCSDGDLLRAGLDNMGGCYVGGPTPFSRKDDDHVFRS